MAYIYGSALSVVLDIHWVPWNISPAEKGAYCNGLKGNEKVTGEISDVITLGQRTL